MATEVAEVVLWGKVIGAVAWNHDQGVASFEYRPEFIKNGIELSPIRMPLGHEIYSFPGLARESFYGLPGMLADSLPDKFGNLLIDEWLVRTGRDIASFTPVERLCYIGMRGMGALEFKPGVGNRKDSSDPVDIASLVELATKAIEEKEMLLTNLEPGKSDEEAGAMREILRVGTSAGGARAKAIIAWNEKTSEIRSGQIKAPKGFGYWIMKFDGVSGNKDKELEDPKGYGKIEYAYYLMAKEAGVEMSECRLYHENNRSHFMTRRFDRTNTGQKIFMQSLCGLGHMDFNQAGAYGYEQAMDVGLRLKLNRKEIEQIFRRMIFNVLARNQDDHTKNMAFLMDKEGKWSLSPAFDVIYSHNPDGKWTNQHQMTINGKRDHFVLEDFYAVGKRFRIGNKSAIDAILKTVDDAMGTWGHFAAKAQIPEKWIFQISNNHRRLDHLK